ncbi:MAG: ABC transporter ATP-binding protein, partial [Candidatus Ureaplasma intestinipullorum]|nr:ABC transporter ATP-binding protein [Candidatus Ureaplasma intestinipullorum]
MRRPEFLAALDFLYEKLEKNNVEISKLSFKQRFLINLNLLFNFFRLPFSIEVSTKNMNEIEKEIFKLKRLYYYKKNIDDKYDKLQDKYNDLDYDISYWQNYPNLQKEAFEKRNITRKLTKEEIEQKTKYVIKLVGLEGKEDKYPHDLSGGMQQRVALARSIVIETEILLLDEPLGALDAKVRKQLQDEIKRLHKELGLTFILVTHDQEEALMLSDKIVVMSEGKIEQIGTPNEIYDTPQNLWVANFIGRANILNGVMKENDVVEFYDVVTNVKTQENIHTNDKVKIIIRPEDIDIVKNKKGVLNNVEILDVIYKGLLYDIKCKYNENIINVESTDNIEIGSIVGLKFDLSDIHLIKDKNNE